ncbi:MAG: riboflavin synthase [bacterium]
MFTGLIDRIGEIEYSRAVAAGRSIGVSVDFADELDLGESIAVDGVCLTVVSKTARGFMADVSAESLKRSTLGGLRKGSRVNLERALKANSRLGGHFVQGHVDCVSQILEMTRRSDFAGIRIALPREFSTFVVEKGSIAVSGVSLTIAEVGKSDFEIAVIPETLKRTTLGTLKQGSPVNIEFDILAKYVQKKIGKDYAQR